MVTFRDFLLLLLLTSFKAHGQDGCAHNKGEIGTCLTAGERRPDERLNTNDDLNNPGVQGQIVFDDATITLNRQNEVINYVEVVNMYESDQGTVVWTHGGIGERYIKLHLESQRSKGYSFHVKVYSFVP